MEPEQIIIQPILTEKSTLLAEQGKYVFKVAKKATKNEIKKAVGKIFKVKVKDVNIINISSKTRRRGRQVGKKSGFKKAIVTLYEGEKIEELLKG